jgi:hypothetical protein
MGLAEFEIELSFDAGDSFAESVVELVTVFSNILVRCDSAEMYSPSVSAEVGRHYAKLEGSIDGNTEWGEALLPMLPAETLDSPVEGLSSLKQNPSSFVSEATILKQANLLEEKISKISNSRGYFTFWGRTRIL